MRYKISDLRKIADTQSTSSVLSCDSACCKERARKRPRFTVSDTRHPKRSVSLPSSSYERVEGSEQMVSQQRWEQRANRLKEAEHEVKLLEEQHYNVHKRLAQKQMDLERLKIRTRKQAFEHFAAAATAAAAAAAAAASRSKDTSFDISSIEKKSSNPSNVNISNVSANSSSSVSKYRVSTPTRRFDISIQSDEEKEVDVRAAVTKGLETLEKEDIRMALEDPATKKR